MNDDNNTASKLMNDEIKEILDNLKDEVWSKTGADSYDKLLDYITNLQEKVKPYETGYINGVHDERERNKTEITNLQQENQELNDSITWWNNRFNAVQRDYEELKQENERLKQPKIFIDTQDMEERYGEELYKEYLEKQVKDYKSRIEKANEFINENTELEHDGDDYGYTEWINIINMDTMTFINNLSDILNGKEN